MQLPYLLLLLLLFFFQTINCSPFSDCAPLISYTCGSRAFNISYPFRVTGRPDNCGYPGYYVDCTGDNSTLTILNKNKSFQVTSIDYVNSLLNIVDTNLLQQSCPDQSYTNTSIDTALFQYSDRDRNMTLYFDCSTTYTPPGLFDIGCLTGQHSYYRLDNETMDDLLGMCSSTVKVPLGQGAAEDLVNGNLGLSRALQQGFNVRWVAGGDWCGGCVGSGGYCGFNVSDAKQHTCFCPNGTFTGSCDVGDGGNGARKKIIIGSAAGVGFLVVCLSLVLYFYKHWKVSDLVIFGKKDLNNNKKIEALLKEYGSVTPKRYTYSNVKEITKAFHEKLGQGGYGTVYKGTLRNGHAVAVKILNDSKGDGEEFINEVASICRTSHVNVVSLLGFCLEGSKKALIYDFMCNGSLEKLFYSEKSKTTHDWQRLYEIAIGIARGLEYLHRGCNTRIVHFDIKPHNILLDQSFYPKISDFGLAKLCLQKESIISIAGARGTIGYIAPEVFSRNFGVVSSKSDVYSYGMLVLEIVGGRKNPNEGVENSSEAYFPHWIYTQLNQNGHLSSCGVIAESEEIVRKMVLVGLWCIQTLPENRPSISRVIEMMEGSVDDLQIPPKPYLSSSPFGSIIGTSSVQDVCWIDCSSSVDS